MRGLPFGANCLLPFVFAAKITHNVEVARSAAGGFRPTERLRRTRDGGRLLPADKTRVRMACARGCHRTAPTSKPQQARSGPHLGRTSTGIPFSNIPVLVSLATVCCMQVLRPWCVHSCLESFRLRSPARSPGMGEGSMGLSVFMDLIFIRKCRISCSFTEG